MIIHFYLNNEEETPITSLYEMGSNPFNIGDVIGLDVEELYPIEYNKYNPVYREKMIKDSEALEKAYRRKSIKIISEGKYMNIKMIKETSLTIEYHCELVEKESKK